jgi:hypothetical protein
MAFSTLVGIHRISWRYKPDIALTTVSAAVKTTPSVPKYSLTVCSKRDLLARSLLRLRPGEPRTWVDRNEDSMLQRGEERPNEGFRQHHSAAFGVLATVMVASAGRGNSGGGSSSSAGSRSRGSNSGSGRPVDTAAGAPPTKQKSQCGSINLDDPPSSIIGAVDGLDGVGALLLMPMAGGNPPEDAQFMKFSGALWKGNTREVGDKFLEREMVSVPKSIYLSKEFPTPPVPEKTVSIGVSADEKLAELSKKTRFFEGAEEELRLGNLTFSAGKYQVRV